MLTPLLLVLTSIAHPQANSWQGIVPLHSTRIDVEKILGPPRPESKGLDASTYKTGGEKVFVLYSTGPCNAKPSNGWNVPRGTVIEVSVEPNVKPKLSDFKLDLSKFKKNRDPEVLDYTYYTDDGNGISITVNTVEGVVVSINYWPTSKENYLRCSTPIESTDQTFGFLPQKFAEYSNISLASERRRLGDFAKLLRRFNSTQGHIIAYAGKNAAAGEANRLADRAKNYLVKSRGIKPARLLTIDGGHREKPTVELYIVPLGVTPPAAAPSVSLSEAQIIKAGKVVNRAHSSRAGKYDCPN
jgi:hypothetical protein